jgi:hypothetical protein
MHPIFHHLSKYKGQQTRQTKTDQKDQIINNHYHDYHYQKDHSETHHNHEKANHNNYNHNQKDDYDNGAKSGKTGPNSAKTGDKGNRGGNGCAWSNGHQMRKYFGVYEYKGRRSDSSGGLRF